MKVTVTRKNMLQALMVGGSMAGKSKTLPILNCVKVTVKGQNMTISSYDGQNSITKIFAVESSDEDASFCVDSKDLTSLLKAIRDERVELSLDEYNLRVIHKKGNQTLPLDDASEYPQPARDEKSVGFTINAGILREMLCTARNFIQTNDLKPQMASVYVGVNEGRINFAATDGFSLFADSIEAGSLDDCEATININAVSPLIDMLSSACDVSIGIGERMMSFRTEDAMLVSMMSEYKYPDYRRIIPKDHSVEVKIDKNELLDTLSRVMITANKESLLVKMFTEGMTMNVVSEDEYARKSKESILCESTGDICIGVKGTYLKTCLEQVVDDTIVFNMTSPTRPIVLFDATHEDRTIMLMPMAL